jgi:hypothetical protein
MSRRYRAFEAIRLDDRSIPPHGNLVGSLIALNRFDRAELACAAASGVDVPPDVRRPAGVSQKMHRRWRASWVVVARRRRCGPRTGSADICLFGSDARAQSYTSAPRKRHRSAFNELGAQWIMEDAESRLAGQCTRHAARSRRGSSSVDTLRWSARTRPGSLQRPRTPDFGGGTAQTHPNATLTMRIYLP